MEKDFSFWKNMVLIVVFVAIAPITLGVSLFSLLSLSKSNNIQVAKIDNSFSKSPYGLAVFASLPLDIPTVDGQVESSDARPVIIKNYLQRYESPLDGHEGFIVETADKYGLDFRLVTAISQQESNLCKIIPPGGYNCWGWGIHSEGTLGFNSYAQGIETVSKGLRENYLDKGYKTVEEIMSKYTPLSNGSWAHGVNSFMEAMQ